MSNAGRRPPARRSSSGAAATRPSGAASGRTRRSPTPPTGPPRRSLFGFDRGSRRRRIAGLVRRARVPLLVVAVSLVGVLSLAVVPTRTYLERRGEITEAEARLARLVSANEADAARIAALDTDAELERVARRDFRLALPGEEVYRVLPPVIDPASVPDGWPFDGLARRLADG